MNFVKIFPGDAKNLFPKTITIKESDALLYKVHGKMFLLSIWVTNPDAKVLGFEVLKCWAQADCVVFPRSVIYKKHTSTKVENRVGIEEMKKSQSNAARAALALIAERYPEINLTKIKNSSIDVTLENTGGPSGGLIFALGIVELLTPTDLLGGRTIAGTGTISPEGDVGAIGGLAEKILAADRSGVQTLFISRANCDEIPTTKTGLTVVAISKLADAIDYLISTKGSAMNPDGGRVLGCDSVGT